MNIQQMNYKTAASVGIVINTMPKRGYALRTINENLFIFRQIGSSWAALFNSMMKAFNVNRHLKVVICVMPGVV
tara:strand:- start:68 stop:289 length:222 start_codon:yes stop_codon:yes gene_type:complete